MSNPFNIFILAAGPGKRLRPITNHIPKPLVPVLGKPVLQYILENISSLPFNKIGINLNHKKESIEKWVSECSLKERIILFHEETELDTGGALKNAERFLNKGTFLVHNSDILSNINLAALLEHHLSSKNIITLAVHDYPEFNNLIIDEKGFLKGIGKTSALPSEDGQKSAFTGIAVYEPEFLEFLPVGASGVVNAWLNAMSAGFKVGTFDVCRGGFQTRPYWNDIGTPSAYASAVFDALRDKGEVIFIHPSMKKCNAVDLQGRVVIEEKCKLSKNISLKNCILLPDSNVETGTGAIHELDLLENCIIGPGFKIDLVESEILSVEEDGRQLIGTGGSDRKYYRGKLNDKSVVIMQSSGNDPDFERQIEYTRFFLKHSIPVPELIKVDSNRMQAIFEDAGDISLYSYLKCPREKTEIEDSYRSVINVMTLIHTRATKHISESPLLQKRIFDYDYFRWETDYFIKRFVEEIRNIRVENASGMQSEFHRLALKADSFPKTIIHRDFQSQNIMIMKGQELRIIDYQGARIGPPAYDVASILRDPYYRLEDNMRERLLDYYINQMKDKTGERFDENYFNDTLLSCWLQRHMQALGAYGFLSSIKGKKYFLKYVPEGLRLLKEDISLAKDEYPELYKLIMRL
ncbi:MAG TPA: hypothetical protein ENG83_05960 [Nitrospirae bacterium]|nr:D-glycero-alpha-D-manno-heptose 1-phosphate guanylyltransferase [bacterium BMS3Abin06]HDH11727.1 hypothetical protein [Nitrospirota bacterium]HDZ02563.1 hypothetical protein [Nitrospirota bacterium]